MNQQVLKFVTDLAIDNFEKIVKLGEGGVKALKVLLDTNSIKAKNDKIEKVINNYYMEIGKLIFEKRLVVNNTKIKEKIEEINDYKKEIEKNIDKINEMKQKAKEEGVSERDFEIVKKAYEKLNKENLLNKQKKNKNKKKKQKKWSYKNHSYWVVQSVDSVKKIEQLFGCMVGHDYKSNSILKRLKKASIGSGEFVNDNEDKFTEVYFDEKII